MIQSVRKGIRMNYSIKSCEGNDAKFIRSSLVQYNVSKVPKTQEVEFEPVDRKIVDENGKIIGGCLAEVYCWKIMFIDILWFDEAYRKQGLGSQMLQEMERIAREKNCTLIHLDTYDFQAKDFYLKHGFEVFGVLEDCPPGHCRYFLKKSLK